MDGEPSESLPRYCTKCGEIFQAALEACPECRTRWPRTLPINRVEAYTLLLTEIAELRRAGEIEEAAYHSLREIYEARLKGTRPARRFVPQPAPPRPVFSAAAAAGPAPSMPSRSPFVPRPSAAPPATVRSKPTPPARAAQPPKPPRDTITPMKQWAVRRQADLVLYLGAFLLSVAALIFVDYQGSVLSGLAKSAILGTYTVLFLAFGIALRRWERVREAGPVFVALGAILTPLNFVMLYTETLRGGDTPQAWLWLGGSAGTSALYFLLAARGFGRLYAVPASVAAVVAWGSLGATVHLPLGWYGAWYLAAMVAGLQYAETQLARLRPWVEALAALVALGALAWAHGFGAVADAFGERLALSATYALVFSAAALVSALRRSPAAYALIPITGVMALAALTWAVPVSHDVAFTWAATWPVFMAGGYLMLAFFDRKHETNWFAGAAILGFLGVALAHGLAVAAEAMGDKVALSVVYALVFGGAATVAALRRHSAAFALLPVTSVMSVAALAWAIPASHDNAVTWAAIWPTIMAGGYLAVALVDPKRRVEWCMSGAYLGILATVLAHLAVGDGDVPERLPVVYGGLLLLAATAFGRWQFSLALGFVPALAAATLVSALWATERFAFEWSGVALASTAVAYVGLTLVQPWRRDYWRFSAAGAAALGLGAAHLAAGTLDTMAWQLPAAYAVLLLGAVMDAVINRQAAPLLIVPVALSAGAASVLWASGVSPELWAIPALVVAAALTLARPITGVSPILEGGRWPYLLALGLAPLTSFAAYADEPIAGAASLAAAGFVFLAGALFSGGAFVRLTGLERQSAVRIEQQMLARIAAAFMFGAAGYVADWLDLVPAEAAYIYAGTGITALLAVPLLRVRVAAAEGVLAPIGVTGVVLAVLMAYPEDAQVALMLGAATIASALATGGQFAPVWRGLTYVAAGWAVLVAHNHAAEALDPRDAWQLPVAYAAVLLAAVADTAINRFRPGLLLTPLFGTMTAAATLWVFEIQPEHWAWAPLALSGLVLATDRAWRRTDTVTGGAYLIAAALGLVPAFFVGQYDHVPFAGAAQMIAASFLWLALSLRSRGALTSLLGVQGAKTTVSERVMLQLVAAALAMGAIAHLNLGLELAMQTSAWVFAAAGTGAYVVVAAMGRRVGGLAATLMPAGTAALLLGTWASEPRAAAFMLWIGTIAVLATYRGTREPATFLLAAAYGAGALAFNWVHLGLPAWSLGLTYASTGVVLNIGLVPLRNLGGSRGRSVAAILSSVPIAGALAMALGVVLARAEALPHGQSILPTAEWRALAAVIAMLAAVLLDEAWVRRERGLAYAGSAVALLALELGVASFDPANVQWYTGPVAIYLFGLGLSFRRSDEVVSRHVFAHELLFIMGAAVLFLPQVEQSYDGQALTWAVVILAEATLLLAAGMALGQRWLVVAGVVASIGVAARFFTSGEAEEHVPYWLTLGVAGLLLLGVGMLLLLARDWWDRTRERLSRWWVESPVAG